MSYLNFSTKKFLAISQNREISMTGYIVFKCSYIIILKPMQFFTDRCLRMDLPTKAHWPIAETEKGNPVQIELTHTAELIGFQI